MINTRLQEMLAEARADVRKDEDYWTEEGQGQDTEEAEESGYLIGYAAGLAAAVALLDSVESVDNIEAGLQDPDWRTA